MPTEVNLNKSLKKKKIIKNKNYSPRIKMNLQKHRIVPTPETCAQSLPFTGVAESCRVKHFYRHPEIGVGFQAYHLIPRHLSVIIRSHHLLETYFIGIIVYHFYIYGNLWEEKKKNKVN